MKWYPRYSFLFACLVGFSMPLVGQRLKGDEVLWLFAPLPFFAVVNVMMRIKYERWRDLERYKGLSTRKGRA